MPSNQFDEVSILYNLKKIESETPQQYLNRLSIAKDNKTNFESDHDLISLANLDNDFILNAIDIFNVDKIYNLSFINHSLKLSRIDESFPDEEYSSDDEEIYLLKDLIDLLKQKGFVCKLKDEDLKEYKTSFLFAINDRFVSNDTPILNKVFKFPTDVIVNNYYFSSQLNLVSNDDELKVNEYSFTFNESTNTIKLSPLLRDSVSIVYSGYKINLSWHWSLNKLYDVYDSSFDKLTLTNDKLLTPKGVYLYNLINKTYSSMWG